MKDPLLIITAAVSLCLLVVFGRYAVTGTFDKEVAGVLATVLGGLITALSTRRQQKDDDPEPDPPRPPDPPLPPPGGAEHDARD